MLSPAVPFCGFTSNGTCCNRYIWCLFIEEMFIIPLRADLFLNCLSLVDDYILLTYKIPMKLLLGAISYRSRRHSVESDIKLWFLSHRVEITQWMILVIVWLGFRKQGLYYLTTFKASYIWIKHPQLLCFQTMMAC